MNIPLLAALLTAVAAFFLRPRVGATPESSTSPLGSGAFFDGVAPSYDLLNRVISLGLDQSWRREAAKEAAGQYVASRATVRTLVAAVGGTGKAATIFHDGEDVDYEAMQTVVLSVSGMKCQGCVSRVRAALENIDGVKSVEVTLDPPRAIVSRKIVTGAALDVASGTGDLARILVEGGAFKKIVALDPSAQMLSRLRLKMDNSVDVVLGVAEKLPYDDSSFSAITVGFGVRNFADKEKGLAEMFRVLEDNGRLVILEASVPRGTGLFHTAARFFIGSMMPAIGAVVSGRLADYRYLSTSMDLFPAPVVFIRMLEDAGFVVEAHKRLWPYEAGPDMYVAVKQPSPS